MRTATALFRSDRAENNGFMPRPGFRPFDPLDAESTLGEWFRDVAVRRAACTAVVDGERRITYAELLDRAETIATNLRNRCGNDGGVVAICQLSSLPTIETILGALIGGFAYFCLDPMLPAIQKRRLLQAVEPVAVEGPDMKTSDAHGRSAPMQTAGPGGVAALYATSGSTGEPKMVALSHRAILFDIGRQTNDLYLGPDDRFDSLFSPAFSASLATNFGALLNGAELHCFQPRHQMTALPTWLAQRKITVSTMTVSMLRHLCLLGHPTSPLSALRLLSVGGEALHLADIDAFRHVFPPSCILQNAMASTETRTYAQFFVPPSGPIASPVPIGFPVAGKEILLLDDSGSPVANGSKGEIAVRSHYLASGYSNDPSRTAIKFQPMDGGSMLYRTGDRGCRLPDGSLTFLGRVDSQAKIRGHRVELDHVAQVLELQPEVQTCVVITCHDSKGNDQLVAYVVIRPDRPVTQKQLRASLRLQLPEYAVPSTFTFLPELPLNANFKVDRRSLRPPSVSPVEKDVLQSGDTYEVLRSIWETVLQCSKINDDDDFVSLGGDSLNAVRILVAVHERFGCDLPPDTLHRYPSLKLFCDCVQTTILQGDPNSNRVIVFNSEGTGCPFFFAPGLNGSTFGFEYLASRLGSSHPAYGLNVSSWFGATGISVEALAASHVAEIEKVITPGEKIVLVGHSFGGTIAFAIAAQLRKRGLADPLPVVIDMPAVNAPGRQQRTFSQKLVDLLRNLPPWFEQEITHFHPGSFLLRCYGNLRRISCALRGLPPARKLDPLIYFGQANLPEAYQGFLTAMYQAMHNFVPEPYEGKIILLRAKVPTLFRTHHATMGWETIATGGVEVHIIPGRHDDCMSELHAPDLATILLRCAAVSESTTTEVAI